MQVNALVNTAVVTAMAEEEFHEAGEGLGILALLPPDSDASRAKALVDQLVSVAGPPPA